MEALLGAGNLLDFPSIVRVRRVYNVGSHNAHTCGNTWHCCVLCGEARDFSFRCLFAQRSRVGNFLPRRVLNYTLYFGRALLQLCECKANAMTKELKRHLGDSRVTTLRRMEIFTRSNNEIIVSRIIIVIVSNRCTSHAIFDCQSQSTWYHSDTVEYLV